jgi:hypothetical protein
MCVWGIAARKGLGSGQKLGFLRDGEEVEEDWRTGGGERDHGNVEKRLSETNRHATKIMRVCMWRDGREGRGAVYTKRGRGSGKSNSRGAAPLVRCEVKHFSLRPAQQGKPSCASFR